MANIPFLNNAYFAAKVGIGVESPTVGLQLGNSVSGETKLAIFNSEGGSEVGLTIKSRTNRAKLRVSDNDSNAYVVAEAGKAFFGTSANGDANNITVLTGGNVGIGTSTPSAKLDVQGSLGQLFSVTDNLSGEIFAVADISGVPIMTINSSGVSYFDGSVGIGTTSPSQKLEVNGNVLISSGTGGILALGDTSNSISALGTDLYFVADGSIRMNIFSDGAIKFNNYDSTNNTGTPTYILGTDASGNVVKVLGGDIPGSGGTVTGSGTTNYVPMWTNGTNGVLGDSVVFQTGTNRLDALVDTLELSNDWTIQSTDGNYWQRIRTADGSAATTNAFNFETRNGSGDFINHLTIENSGNVGIGITAPNNLLNLQKNVADGDVAIYIQNFNSVVGSTNETTSLKFAHGNDNVIGYEAAKIVGGKEGDFESSIANIKGFLSFSTASGTSLTPSVNNTEKMRILGNGNVGIGTDDPQSLLHIFKSVDAGVGGELRLDNNNAAVANKTRILFSDGNGASDLFNRGAIVCETEASPYMGQLQFQTGVGTISTKMIILGAGNVGINITGPTQKLDVDGVIRARQGQIINSNIFIDEKQTVFFTNGTANLNVDIVLPNASLWGYLEVDTTSFYNNQNALGKLTKIYGIGLNVGGTIFAGQERISDSLGSTPDNIHLGPVRWDSATSTFRIRVAHIVSTGNRFTIKVSMLSPGGRAINLANAWSLSAAYTQSTTGLTRQEVYYNNKLGIGTATPAFDLDVNGTGNFTGLVSGITPTAAANFATKAYVDVHGGGLGPFLPLAGGTMDSGATITTSGALGVGVAAGSNAKLEVVSTTGEVFRADAASGAFRIVADQTGVNTQGVLTHTGTATFSGDVSVEDNLYLTDAGTNRAKIQLNSTDRDNLDIKAVSIGSTMNFFTADTLALGLDASQNATFAGTVAATSYFLGTTTEISLATSASGTIFLRPNGQSTSAQSSFTTSLATIGTSLAVTGAATSTTATTGTDDNATLTTKGYVDGLVTGVPVYKGTWAAGTTGVTSAIISSTTITLNTAPTETIAIGDVVTADGITAAITVTAVGSQTSVTVNASVAIASGVTVTFSSTGGYPNLTLAENKVLGNYYIVSTAGSARPNGTGTEPDSWAIGDWCIFSDITPGAGTDLWQRIDNSSVVSGAGTGQSVTKWEGTLGANSETLTDGPITFSGNDSTFAGIVTIGSVDASVGEGLNIGNASPTIQLFDTTNDAKLLMYTQDSNSIIGTYSNHALALFTDSTQVLNLDTSQNATFAGDVIVKTALLSNQENTVVDTGTETVAAVSTATYTAAFFDFVIKKGLNVRSGTVYACHNGDTTPLIQFTETSTQDLGDTSDVVLIVNYSSPNFMRLQATVASDGWSIKSLIRAI